MAQWTTRTQANASPEQVLEVLTDPDAIRLWSPIDFEVEDLDGARLAAGDVTRVTGSSPVRVGFDVEVHAADEDGLELTADGPIGIDVRYELAPAAERQRGHGVGRPAHGRRHHRPPDLPGDRRAAVGRSARRSRAAIARAAETDAGARAGLTRRRTR